MRVFQYLSIFDFFVRYKTNKMNVVSDALSRLSGNFIIITKDDLRILKVLYKQVLKIIKNFSFRKEKSFLEKLFNIYYITFVKMFDNFKSRLFFKIY